MKKILFLALLVAITSFAQQKTKSISLKQNVEKIKETKTTLGTVYTDSKDGVKIVYDDLKSLGIESKKAMKDIVLTVKEASLKTWSLLVKQQQVWSWCYLITTISSIIMFFRFLGQFKITKNDLDQTGALKESNIILSIIIGLLSIALGIFSCTHFEQMLTGFINPEFGALRTLIELGSKIK